MNVKHLVCLLSVFAVSPALAVVSETIITTTSTPINVEGTETQQTTLSEESETKGVIPVDADTMISTQPVTPTSVFPEKPPYDQARDELIHAMDLWAKGHPEAASDTALEAYDDFISLHRVPGVKRTVIREQAHQAAKVYTEAGIAYIKAYTARMGNSPEAIEEGRSRMDDLRDVARNYVDLNKMLNSAISQLSHASDSPAKK